MTIFEFPLPPSWTRGTVTTHYRVTKKPRQFPRSSNNHITFVPMEKVPAGGQTACGFELRLPEAVNSGTYFEAGDVLLSKITPSFENGKQGMATGLPNLFGYASTEIIPLQAISSKASNLYLFYLLLHHEVRASLASKMEGSTGRQRVPEGSVRDLVISYPPSVEQQKIAAVLWKLQRAIATQGSLITATLELKQASMARLFTRGLLGDITKETELGLMPDSWNISTIGQVAQIGSGGTPSRANPTYWVNGTIPWVKTGEVDYCVITQTEEKITALGMRESAARIYPTGTLLVAMYGQGITRGKVAILGIDAATNQACAALRITDKAVHTEFLYHVLTHGYERLRGLAHGGQQQNLNADLIRSFSFGLPPTLDEQRDITAALAVIDKKIDHHERKRAALDDLFQTMLHKLMTAEIRVADLDIDTSEMSFAAV